jgi:hypothetical protein
MTATDRDRRQDERRQGERRRGRPPFKDTSQMSNRLPGALHDRLTRLAAHRGEDVSATVRWLLDVGMIVEQLFFASRNPDVRGTGRQ